MSGARVPRSVLARSVGQLAAMAALLGVALAVPDDRPGPGRYALAAGALLLVVAAALTGWRERGRRRRVRELAPAGAAALPGWTASLAEAQVAELQQLVLTLERRARLAEQHAEQSRRRSSASLSGMWQVMASAVSAEEHVRGRFVADLHDTVVQQIIAATYMAEDNDIPREQLAEHLREAEHHLREIMVLTRPPELTRASLGNAAYNLTRTVEMRHGLEVHWSWPRLDQEIPEAAAVTVYRFFQEALNNVAKHAGVDEASAGLELGPQLVAWVRDAGRGFDPQERPREALSGHHVGLTLMAERAQQVGAAVEVDSAPGEGTAVTLRLRMPEDEADRPVQLGEVAARGLAVAAVPGRP